MLPDNHNTISYYKGILDMTDITIKIMFFFRWILYILIESFQVGTIIIKIICPLLDIILSLPITKLVSNNEHGYEGILGRVCSNYPEVQPFILRKKGLLKFLLVPGLKIKSRTSA